MSLCINIQFISCENEISPLINLWKRFIEKFSEEIFEICEVRIIETVSG